MDADNDYLNGTKISSRLNRICFLIDLVRSQGCYSVGAAVRHRTAVSVPYF